MNTRRLLLATFGLLVAAATPVWAQTFPDKPVKVVMPYPAGTGPDAVMRYVGERLSKTWGQPLLVDNKPGGNGWIGLDAVKRSAPDGYTFLMIDQAIMSLHPHLYKKMPVNTGKDFEAVAPMYSTNYFVTVAPNSKWKSFTDLVNDAKTRGKPLTYGSSGVGGQLHIGGALTEAAAGIPMTHVPYKDIAQLYVDISEGNVDFAFATAATAGPLLKAGKVKFLAYAAPKRNPRYPDVPTVAEAGGPADLQVSTWMALFAPAGVPAAVKSKVNADVTRIISAPETQEFLANIGFSAWPGSAKDLADTMARDGAGYSEFVKRFKLSLD